MVYKGYRIIRRGHPTPFNENQVGYDDEEPNGHIVKANFLELEHCKHTIEQMIKLKHWPKYC